MLCSDGVGTLSAIATCGFTLSVLLLSRTCTHCSVFSCLQVKLWEIPSDGISGSLSSSKATFGPMEVSGRGGREGGERERVC